MSKFVVSFIGLPSSGKSSIINSLFGKRIYQTGVSRTTITSEECNKELLDDNNNKYYIIDLPGICDSEENNDDFTILSYENAIKSSLVFWTTDVSKAFITTHECNEFNKLRNHIIKYSSETGKLINLAIIISKCEWTDNEKKTSDPNEFEDCDSDKSDNELKEITDMCEDTNIGDIIKNVQEKFKDVDIIKFNAHGRSLHHKKSSTNLKNFIKTISPSIPSSNNTEFDITKYYKNYLTEQTNLYYETFFNYFQFLVAINSQTDNSTKFRSLLSQLNFEQIKTFIKNIYDDNNLYDDLQKLFTLYSIFSYNVIYELFLIIMDTIDHEQILNIGHYEIFLRSIEYGIIMNKIENRDELYKNIVVHNKDFDNEFLNICNFISKNLQESKIQLLIWFIRKVYVCDEYNSIFETLELDDVFNKLLENNNTSVLTSILDLSILKYVFTYNTEDTYIQIYNKLKKYLSQMDDDDFFILTCKIFLVNSNWNQLHYLLFKQIIDSDKVEVFNSRMLNNTLIKSLYNSIFNKCFNNLQIELDSENIIESILKFQKIGNYELYYNYDEDSEDDES